MINKIKTFKEVSFVALIFVLSIMGVILYGIHESNKQNKISKELYNNRMVPIGQLGEIRHHLSDMLLISGKVNQNKIPFSDAEKLMKQHYDSIQLLWNTYLGANFTDSEKINAKKISGLFHNFSKTVQELRRCLKNNDSETFDTITENDFYPITTTLLGNVNDLIFLQFKEGKNIFEKSYISYNASKEESIIIMIFILFFSVIFSYYFIKKSVKTINNLNFSGKKLVEVEKKYHSLIEHAGDAIFVIVENKNIVEVNSTTCELLGYSREELLGMGVLDVYPSNSSDYFATRWDLIKEGKTVLSETKLQRKDGSLVDVEINRKQLNDNSYLSIVRDITERKMIQNELIEYKEKLKLFIEYSPVSIAMFDNEMNYIANSRRWLTDFQVANRSVIGMNHYDVFPELGQDWKDIHQRCLNGAVEKNNNDMFYRPDGKLEWIEWEIHPWKRANGEIGGIIMSVEITTEKKQATEMFKHQFENSPDIIIYINRQLKIESINRCSFLNLGIDELIGADCVAIIPEKSQDLIRGIINKCFETRALQEIEVELDNNQWRFSRYVPIVNNDEVTHVMIFSTDISTRKQAEQNLRRSEERYRALTENISDAILLVNEKFEIEYLSPAAERISGYSNKELKSKKLFDFVHSDERLASSAFFLKAYNCPNVSFQNQFRILNKNGDSVWIEGTVLNLLENKDVGCFVVNYREITSRKKLEEQQALMASIVNSSDDAIISKTIDGIVTSWNIGAEKVLGYTASEMIGENIQKLIPISHIEEEKKILDEIRSGRSLEHFETKRVKKNGELIDVSITISPVKDVLGTVVGASKIMRDITNNKKTEEELIRYNTDLKKANSELDRFVYSTSHDLRAPLKSILGLLNITKEYANQENEDLIDCLDMLDISVLKLDGFIEDILNYSRNTRTELDKDTIDFKELICKIRENYLYIEGVKDFDFQLDIKANSLFVADSKRISIVLNNLVSNAFKYRDINKKNPYLKIGFSCDSLSAKITIEDNGIGIANKDKEKVFDMFYRATMLSTGSGLGLYIVKETIDKLNGAICIESEFGKGTKFIIEIPNQINSFDVDSTDAISSNYKEVS